MSGFLEVGLSADGKEVVVNHPDLKPDEHGVGHIVFSPSEARNLAMLLLEKADETDAREPQPVDIVRHLFELSDNPRNPWGLKFAAFVIHDLRAFRDKAVEELKIVEREIGVPSEALKLADLTQQRVCNAQRTTTAHETTNG